MLWGGDLGLGAGRPCVAPGPGAVPSPPVRPQLCFHRSAAVLPEEGTGSPRHAPVPQGTGRFSPAPPAQPLAEMCPVRGREQQRPRKRLEDVQPSCLSDAVTSSGGEEPNPTASPGHGAERKPAPAPVQHPRPVAQLSQCQHPGGSSLGRVPSCSPLVEVVLGVVQPEAHGHRVALSALREDVIHRGSCCGEGWIRTRGSLPAFPTCSPET